MVPIRNPSDDVSQHHSDEPVRHDPAVAKPLTPQQRRYVALVKQLLDEAGGPATHGSKSAVGERLGIPGNHVTMILDGTKAPGQTLIDRATDKRAVRSSYFTDPGPPDLDYRDYDPRRRRTESAEDAVPAVWIEAEEDGTIDHYRRAGVLEETLLAIQAIPGARGGAMTRGELLVHLNAALTNAALARGEPEEAARARERVEPDLAHRIKTPRRS